MTLLNEVHEQTRIAIAALIEEKAQPDEVKALLNECALLSNEQLSAIRKAVLYGVNGMDGLVAADMPYLLTDAGISADLAAGIYLFQHELKILILAAAAY